MADLAGAFAEAGATEAALRDAGGTASTSGSGDQHHGAEAPWSFAAAGGWSSQLLAFAQQHCESFDRASAAFVENMAACGWCGRCALGGPHCAMRSHMRPRHSDGVPPAVLANPLLLGLDLVRAPGAGDMYWACQSCRRNDAGGAKRREKQEEWLQASVIGDSSNAEDIQAAMKEWTSMLGLVMSMPAGTSLQLSVLKCAVRFAQDIRAYVHSMQPTQAQHLVSGPLVSWGDMSQVCSALGSASRNAWQMPSSPFCGRTTPAVQMTEASCVQLTEHFEALVDYLRRTNPIVQRFATLYEQNFKGAGSPAAPAADTAATGAAAAAAAAAAAVPIVPSTALGPSVAATQVCAAGDAWACTPLRCPEPPSTRRRNEPNNVASLQARDPRATAPDEGGNCDLTGTMAFEDNTAAGQRLRHTMFACGQVLDRTGDGAPEAVMSDAAGCAAEHNLTFDAAMFPFLHPGGKGAFRSGESLSDLLQQRMQQLFSPFCLQKEYVLLMYQVG